MLIKTVHDTASYLGFGLKCLNGGHKTEDGTCICAKYFKGKECETKICINGGKLERVTVPIVSHVCKCQHPTNIAGTHCEKIRCDNGAPLKHHTNGTWSCDCTSSRFYGGTFCEKFILSSGWLMLLIGVGVFLILAFICSSNWFSRKRDHRRYNLSNRCPAQVVNHPRAAATSRDVSGRRVASHHRAARSSSADDLISSERGAHRRTAAYPEGLTQQYVVRLDTIPTFNPAMIGKPLKINILSVISLFRRCRSR